MTTLPQYLLALALTISPATSHTDETPADYRARLTSIVEDITAVVYDEPPLIRHDGDRSKTATLLLSLAFWESNFQRYVDRGDCDDVNWRRSAEGLAMIRAHADCDLMRAFTIWQIHPDEGIVLTEETWTRAGNKSRTWLADHGDLVLIGPDLVADRRLAARVALHMIRLSGPGLEGYTGETKESGFPKAKARARFAADWWTKHPYDVNASAPPFPLPKNG